MITKARAKQILKVLGAKDAAAHGSSHDKFPVIQRWLFLTALWRMVNDEGDLPVAGQEDTPTARILARGAHPEDVCELVRQTQIDLLYEVCQLLDVPSHGVEDLQESVPENIEWRLCEYDGETETVGRAMQDLHASFHRFDPTGRGGEPRPRPPKKRPKRAIRS